MLSRCLVVAMLLVMSALPARASLEAEPARERTGPVVVWISIDGFRWDYLDKAETPVLDRLRAEGAYTHAYVPVFPSLTFPAHVSQVTGTPVTQHGIAANAFYCRDEGEVLAYPGPSRLLGAEPIWITAERQGVRTAVLDWPVSHSQEGGVTASRFGSGYNPRMSDDARLGQVLDAWREHEGDEPLQLLMGYAVATDSPGHRYGPDAPEMEGVIADADALVGRFLDEVMKLRREKMHPDDELYFIMTTDHGMSKVEHIVNPNVLLGVEGRRDIRVVNSGNVANVYLGGIEPEHDRRRAIEAMLAEVDKHSFAKAFRFEDVPERLGYSHPGRVGDLVVIMDRGYTFSRRVEGLMSTPEEQGGPLGMHGYDPESNPDMYGFSVIWRYPTPLGGIDLGRMHSMQMHPTVAQILGFAPSAQAVMPPVELPMPAEAGVPVRP
ncbi:MAG: alkaline phosphatase family protein [Phycisphaerales bacterium]|nr:alkaline phosphatase family protein [Phycisphaerales bacterium]